MISLASFASTASSLTPSYNFNLNQDSDCESLYTNNDNLDKWNNFKVDNPPTVQIKNESKL